MLKEIVTTLSILVISKEDEVFSYIGEKYLKYFKKLQVAQSIEEAKESLTHQSSDLIIINIDIFGRETVAFIEEIMKNYPFVHVLISAFKYNDIEVVIKFANLGVSGFISKSTPIESTFGMMLRVCNQIHEQQIMQHYVQELEAQIFTESSSCVKEQITSFKQGEITPVVQNDSIYKDYFTFLMPDDRDELRDVLSEIDVLLVDTSSQTLFNSPEKASSLGDMLSRFGNILMHYQFFSDTGICILELGQMIVTHSDEATLGNRGNDLDIFLSGFCSVLQNFIDEVWEKEAEDPKFYNDSIINDAQMICSLIAPSELNSSEEESDDLIFF